MKALRFRVRNFRNIDDSDWVRLDTVTAFVGRNESGKTALLKALHKFNPGSPEPYDGQRDFPRDRYSSDFATDREHAKHLPVCSVEFEIPEEMKRDIATHLEDDAQFPTKVVVTRNYGGDYAMEFAPSTPSDHLSPSRLLNILDTLGSKVRKIRVRSSNGRESFSATRKEIQEWIHDAKIETAALDDLRSEQGLALLSRIYEELSQHDHPPAQNAVHAARELLDHLRTTAREDSPVTKIRKMIIERLPVFIYFENYGVLDSAVWLSRFLDDRDTNATEPRIRTINAMFKQARVKPDEIVALGGSGTGESYARQIDDDELHQRRRKKEERAIVLNSASKAISTKFSNWWGQRRHAIRYAVDGDFFRIWVTDDLRPDVEMELESRSKGFQWFFSFYLVFLAESDAEHRNAFLLLDEPGLHLHPTAQKDLIKFFERLSESNQLAFTTHSPFMIDGERLDRVRPVTEDETGHCKVSAETWPDDRDTIFPLHAAAGYAIMRGLFRHRKNLLVEGLTDYLYLQALSEQCARAKRPALPEDVYIVPCGGTKNMGTLASLFLSESARPLVLLDGDDAGRARKDALIQELYSGQHAGILMLNEVLGSPGDDREMEDIVRSEYLVPAVSEVVGRPFNLDDEIADRRLTVRITDSAKRQGIPLPANWKWSAARFVVSSWAKTASSVDGRVLDAAARLFTAIQEGFRAIGQDK